MGDWLILLSIIYIGWAARGWKWERNVRDERLPSRMQGTLRWYERLRWRLFYFPDLQGIPREMIAKPADAFQVWGKHAAMRGWLAHTEPKHRRDKVEPKDWQWRRVAAHERSDGLCDHCHWSDGAAQLHVHHRWPRGQGGDHRLSNLVTLCDNCHANEHLLLEEHEQGHYYPPRKYGAGEHGSAGRAAEPKRSLARDGAHCIRCGTGIALNASRPLCGTCFAKWVVHENVDYPEKFCHTCGAERKTSFAKPECRGCYQVF